MTQPSLSFALPTGPCELLDGRALAAKCRALLEPRVREVQRALGRPPGLGVIVVGDHGPSAIYVRNKARAAAKLGMHSAIVRLPENTSQQALEAAIDGCNQDAALDAFLLQLPLPKGLDGQAALARIAPQKDGDGLGPGQAQLLASGLVTSDSAPRAPLLSPCTPAGCLALIDQVLPTLRGAHAVVVGRSNIVGRPMAQLLLGRDATVTVCHSRTSNLRQHTQAADVLVVAAGVPHLIAGDDIKRHAVVIDVGIHRQAQPDGTVRLIGDVDTAQAMAAAGAITPVPGGVGPMTIAMLLDNAVRAAEFTANMQRRTQ